MAFIIRFLTAADAQKQRPSADARFHFFARLKCACPRLCNRRICTNRLAFNGRL